MIRYLTKSIFFLVALFVVPAVAHLGVWSLKDRPSSWHQADWSSAGVLPHAREHPGAKILIMSARTGGLKGAFATHSWIVLKPEGAAHYDRYDVVGWGSPVRKNGYDADSRWYSNPPVIDHKISGEKAKKLIPLVENAIAKYPWRKLGDYQLWPGPNSNTFVASIVRTVPELSAATPSTGVGRDFPADGRWFSHSPDGTLRASLGGYAGLAVGGTVGLELNFLGLVAGLNPFSGELKIPAFGTYRLL